MELKLLKGHTHRGILHPVGAIIDLADVKAAKLEAQGIGIVMKIQVAGFTLPGSESKDTSEEVEAVPDSDEVSADEEPGNTTTRTKKGGRKKH